MRDDSQRPKVSSECFGEEVISSLVFGPEEVDCPEMELTDTLADDPRTIRGTGYLKREVDGRIRFKTYGIDPADVRRMDRELTGTPMAGKLVDRRHYYELKATDVHGETWVADYILPEFLISKYSLVFGHVRELRAEKSRTSPSGRSYMWMHFLEESDFPCNANTEEITRRDGGEPERHWRSRDLAKFTSCGFDFQLHRGPGSIRVQVISDDGMPSHLESRVTEALWFVLGQSLHCRISERASGVTSSIRVTPERPKPFKPTPLPPLQLRTSEANSKPSPVWEMFDKYLQFVLRDTGPDWHPCSIILHKAREARAISWDAWALGLSISVEGLVRCLYPAPCESAITPELVISRLREYLGQWEGIPGWGGEAKLRARLTGFIDQLKKDRPVDRLHRLVERGAIERRFFKAWKDLRNPLAHAETHDEGKRQEFIDRTMSAQVLLNRLVFDAIGYEGPYSDYSTHDWPVRKHPGGSNTDQGLLDQAPSDHRSL